jgi:hypothetical protein
MVKMNPNTLMISALLVMIGILVGIGGTYLVLTTHASRKALEKRITDLEEMVSRQRHTENTIAGIEDAALIGTAEIYRLQSVIEKSNLELDYAACMLKKQAAVLTAVRESPRSYPVDKPSGRRRAPNTDNPPSRHKGATL